MSPSFGTIMLVDDSEIEQLIYARIIRRSGLAKGIVQFVDAAKALKHVLERLSPWPDLILLDINMPGLNGFEFLDEMSAKLDTKLCPAVVVLTSSLNPTDRQRAVRFPQVQDFLNKPLTLQQLSGLGAKFGHAAS